MEAQPQLHMDEGRAVKEGQPELNLRHRPRHGHGVAALFELGCAFDRVGLRPIRVNLATGASKRGSKDERRIVGESRRGDAAEPNQRHRAPKRGHPDAFQPATAKSTTNAGRASSTAQRRYGDLMLPQGNIRLWRTTFFALGSIEL